MKFNDITSEPLSINSGIGQGTILGPLILIFYINDMVKNISHLRVNMYADDCLIYCIGNNWNTMRQKIQEDLNNFHNWCVSNKLKVNVRKSKALLIGSNHKLGLLNLDDKLCLNGEMLQYTDTYNYLGFLLDKNMTLIPFLNKLKRAISNKIYSLVKIRDVITTGCAVTIYKQTILPFIDYSGFLQVTCNVSDRGDLQVLQNHALRICYNVRLRDRMSTRLMHNRANLLSRDQRRRKQLLCLMFIHKERHDVARIYQRCTRAAGVFAFVRERYNCIKYKNSPYYKGSVIWDTLPINVRNSMNLIEFKKHLNLMYRTYEDSVT